MSINVAAKIFDVLCPGSPFRQGYTASIVNLEIVKIVKYYFCMKQAHQSLRRLASTGIFRGQLQIFWPTVANIKKRDYCFGFWFHRFSTNINSIIVFLIFLQNRVFSLLSVDNFLSLSTGIVRKTTLFCFGKIRNRKLCEWVGWVIKMYPRFNKKKVGKGWDPIPYPAHKNPVVLLTVPWEQSELLTCQWSHWTYSLIEIRTGTCYLTNFSTHCRGSFVKLFGKVLFEKRNSTILFCMNTFSRIFINIRW